MKSSKNECWASCKSHDKCLFEKVLTSEHNEIDKSVALRTFTKGQTIFLQGDHPSGVFCLNTGNVKIVMTDSEGNETIVRLITMGDIFGHRSLFCNATYHASAIALEDSVVRFIKKDFFLEIVKNNPSIAFDLLAQISHTGLSAEESKANLVHLRVRVRLARLLSELKVKHGIQDGTRIRLDLQLNRQEMANIIGTIDETIVRLFSEFKKEGVLEIEGKIIYIINEKKLNEIVNA